MRKDLRDAEDEREPKPGLVVSKRLPKVIPSPLARHDAGLVHPQSLDGDELVVLGQKLGLGGRVGHVFEQDDRKNNGDGSKEDEYCLQVISSLFSGYERSCRSSPGKA